VTKTEKKLENAICNALNQVCNIALTKVTGFEWVTHRVNLRDCRKTLTVTCVLATDIHLDQLISSGQADDLRQLVVKQLAVIDIKLQDNRRQIRFDSQQACDNQHDGKWAQRL